MNQIVMSLLDLFCPARVWAHDSYVMISFGITDFKPEVIFAIFVPLGDKIILAFASSFYLRDVLPGLFPFAKNMFSLYFMK